MDTQLTSVKVLKELYSKFRRATIDEKLSLQQLVNRSLNLYISDKSYQDTIKNFNGLQIVSGSQF